MSREILSPEHWTNEGIAAEATAMHVLRAFPNLQALGEGTTFHVYREFIVRRNAIEVTVYAKTAEGVRWRLDADLTEEAMHSVGEGELLAPKHFLITNWYRLDSKV